MSKKIHEGEVNLAFLRLKTLPDFLSNVEVDGDFDCGNNKVKFTEEQVRAVCKVKGEVNC